MKLAETLRLINTRVRDLQAYHLAPQDYKIKLNQNESPWDWPKQIKVRAAKFVLSRHWNRYPDFIPAKLRKKLGRYVGLTADHVVVGNGSNEMLLILLISLINKDTPVIIVEPTFTVYRLLIQGLGGKKIVVPLRNDLQFDFNAILTALRRNPASVLIICSPNNPTGCSLNENQVRKILDIHRGFFILDQAYVEFGGFNAVGLLKNNPNLIITRTFSKAFCGAGLRLGYMLGAPEIVSEISKIKLPYNINFFTDFVGNLLLDRVSAVKARVNQTIRQREEMFNFLSSMPFCKVYPSHANFILVRTKDKDRFFKFLGKKGILVRDVSTYPMLENCLRISIGSKDENKIVQKAIKEYFGMPTSTIDKGLL